MALNLLNVAQGRRKSTYCMTAMNKTSKICSIFLAYVFALVAAVFGAAISAHSQGFTTSAADTTLIKSIHFGGHPDFTRIIIDLDRTAPYRVKPDFNNKRATLTMVNARLSTAVRSKFYSDNSLERIDVAEVDNIVRIHFGFKTRNIRFFHTADPVKSQIVLDFKASPVREINEFAPAAGGGPSAQARRVLRRSAALSQAGNGFEDYRQALEVYQGQDYPEALKAFRLFAQTHPESKFLGHIAFLTAEAEHNIAARASTPDYKKALDAYKFATRQYPASKFTDHSLYKMALIYEAMGHTLDAKALYLDGIKNRRKSRYTSSRKIGLAKILLREDKLAGSYKAFLRILKNSPGNKEARDAVLIIGQKYYQRKNFAKALGIFEKSAVLWPGSLNDNPQVNFQMAEIYFSKKRYEKARKHYFDLFNLAPGADNAHKALNRVGDTYILQSNYKAALAIFHQSWKMGPQSGESQYGQVRMADIGILDPSLPVRDIIIDADPYIQPFKTYGEVIREPRSQAALAEATLSQGIAYMKGQNYLNAIGQFKKLLAFDNGSWFHLQAQKYIRQATVFLIQDHAGKKESLPILYAYSEYLTFSLGEIGNMKTLLQIGESYQDIGMNGEALQFFEKVKQLDLTGVYTERLFLNLGNIHLHEGNFTEAELVSVAFMNKYPQSINLPSAMKLLAASHKQRRQYDAAMEIYLGLLQTAGADIRETHYLIAEIQFTQNNLTGAVASYQSALRGFDRAGKNPEEHIQTSFYKAGIGLHKLGEFSKALHSLNTARSLFPGHPLKSWADYLVADCFTQLSEVEKAALELEAIIKSAPEDGLIQKAAESRLKIIDWEKNVKRRL